MRLSKHWTCSWPWECVSFWDWLLYGWSSGFRVLGLEYDRLLPRKVLLEEALKTREKARRLLTDTQTVLANAQRNMETAQRNVQEIELVISGLSKETR